MMTTATNTSQTTVNPAIVVNSAKGDVKMIVTTKKEEVSNPAKPVSGFAKNTRYSINNNGSGYTGL